MCGWLLKLQLRSVISYLQLYRIYLDEQTSIQTPVGIWFNMPKVGLSILFQNYLHSPKFSASTDVSVVPPNLSICSFILGFASAFKSLYSITCPLQHLLGSLWSQFSHLTHKFPGLFPSYPNCSNRYRPTFLA